MKGAQKGVKQLTKGFKSPMLFPEVSPLNKYLPEGREILRRDNLKLGEIVTLRKELKLDYPTAHSFHKIIEFADLPYNFNQVNKVWWRWHSEAYGFFYHRVKRDYSIWLTTFLKGNIGVYMPFIFGMPNGKQKALDNWRRRAFLYQKTLQKRQEPDYPLRDLSFQTVRYSELSEAAKDLLLPGNRSHRPINSPGRYGLELDMFISGYNAKWHNLYKPESMFFDCGRMPTDFITVVNSVFLNTGFFINSYDSELTLFPQYYLDYKNKKHSRDYLTLSNAFVIENNGPFYYNVLAALKWAFAELSYNNLQNYAELYLKKENKLSRFRVNSYVWYLYFIRFYYGEVQGVNHWLPINLYFSRLQVNLFSFIECAKESYNYATLQRALYFSPVKDHRKTWLKSKELKSLPDWIDAYLVKIAQGFSLMDLEFGKGYFRKAYVSKWIYFWEKLRLKGKPLWLENNTLRSPELIDYLNVPILRRHMRVRNFRKILSYLGSLKGKRLGRAWEPKARLLSPSVVVQQRNASLFKLKWITSFGKVFVKLPTILKRSKRQAIFFHSDRRSYRFTTLTSFAKKVMSRVRSFLVRFGNILISRLKVNFGFSYTLLGEASNLAYFSYNLQSHIYMHFKLFRRVSRLGVKRPLLECVPGFRSWNNFDKNFFTCLHPFRGSSKAKKRLVYMPVTSNWNGIRLERYAKAKPR